MTEVPDSMDTLEIYLEQPVVRLGKSVTELPRLSHALLLQLALATPNPLNIETLRTRVWAGIHVGDDTVKQRVKLLRTALSDAGIERERIETVAGQGYKLIGPFKTLDNRQSKTKESWLTQRYNKLLLVGLMSMVMTIFLLYSGPLKMDKTPAEVSGDIRLAVMPFTEVDHEAERSVIVTSFREELMGLLSRHEGISSVAISSVDAIHSTRVTDVGELLDVDVVVEANMRSDNEQRRLSIRLVDADTEALIWSGEFGQPSRAIQSDWSRIVYYVTKQMFLELENKMPMSRRGGTGDSSAYKAYLEGMHYLKKPFDRDAYQRAIQKFEHAIEQDKGFLLAQAKLAESRLYAALHGYNENDEIPDLVESAASVYQEDVELSESYFAYGLALYLSGKKEQARVFFQKAEKDRPYFKWDVSRLD